MQYKVSKCEVTEIPYGDTTYFSVDEKTKEIVTSIAAVSRGKDKSNNPEVRWNALLKEAALSTPGRPLEYYPCILKVNIYSHLVTIGPYEVYQEEGREKYKNMDLTYFLNHIVRYGYLEYENNNEYIFYTNYRAMIKAGWRPEEIPLVEPWRLEEFKVIKIKCPFFIWAQLMTHTQLSKISQSDRVSGSDEYWLPDDIFKKIKEKREELSGNNVHFDRVLSDVKHNDRDGLLNALITKVSQEDAQEFFKALGYPREIWSRAIYYFKMKTFIMGGWTVDPNTWDNLLLERGAYPKRWKKTWVQKETKEVVEMIKKIINK